MRTWVNLQKTIKSVYKVDYLNRFDSVDSILAILFRFLILVGTIIRFHFARELSVPTLYIIIAIVSAFGIYTFTTLFLFLQYSNKYPSSNLVVNIELVLDTLFVTLFHFISYDPESDLFLLFFFPILIVSLRLSTASLIIYFIVFTLVYGSLIVYLDNGLTLLDRLGRIFFPRWSFFLIVTSLLHLNTTFISNRARQFEQHNKELTKLRYDEKRIHEHSIETSTKTVLEAHLGKVVKVAHESLGTSGSAIFMQSMNKNQLDLVATSGESKFLKPSDTFRKDFAIVLDVMRHNTPIIENHYQNSKYKTGNSRETFEQIMAVPLIVNSSCLGVLIVFNNPDLRKDFKEEDLQKLNDLGSVDILA